MPETTSTKITPTGGCDRRCRCQRKLRCRRHDYNALLALVLWDYGRMLRRKTLK